ncbi:MAG: [protein-PII] uridylyltransferase [Alphaproteobacteria bacterium]|nr:[protein-PII] uridylyltransferase [Alphaproteobacteria bacterium]
MSDASASESAAKTKGAAAKAGALAAAILEAAERQRAGQSYGEAGARLKAILAERRRAITRDYARGDIAAEKFAECAEEAVLALYEAGARLFPELANGLAIAAVGGFGRGRLAPFSDIDLLFLEAPKGPDIRPLLDFILYPLWDAGLKVGHGVHTPASAVDFAKGDMVARTAYLDARRLAGPVALYADFAKRYDKLRKHTKKEFAAAKDRERDERHERSEESRFLAEPDVKEGKGGLRDIHTIRWLYKYDFERDIDDPKAPKKLLSTEDIRALKKCERFLWSVRFQLHDLRGRADERLSFDIQPALAARLGYHDRAGISAAERLMKHFFLNAMHIGRLTRIFSAKLEEQHLGLSPRALKALPKALLADEAGPKANLKLKFGRLAFDSPARARAHPVDFFRLFRAFAKRPDLDFHPDALAVVAAGVANVTTDVRNDPVVAKLFLATLTEAKDPVKTLRVMEETGLLGKYIPSFGKTIGRIEYGLYRRFSIDENVFQSIGVLKEIENGGAKALHPIATSILARAGDKAPFYVALLLHETAWSLRDKSPEAAERLVGRIARRLGLDADDAALVSWCVARRLDMVRTAERRNLAEPHAIARFAELVGDKRRLDLLLVLSVCHLRVVGVYSWDDWTRRQLTELYYGAEAWLAGGDKALDERLEERARKVREAAGALLKDWRASERDAFLDRLSGAMYRTVEPEMVARIADLARAAQEEGASAAVAARLAAGDVEAIVYADDRTGLLADLAGAVAAGGASVRAVQAMTTADGKAVDIFTIQSADGAPIEEPELVRRLHAKLLAAAKAAPKSAPEPARRFGDRRSIFEVKPAVRLDLEASAESVVVEAEGRDRPGLLHDLAAALAEIGVTIISAHVATYGERAVDAFYLQDAPGYKITNKRRLQSIERRLLSVLSSGA